VIIVTGAFTLDPADRDAFVAGMATRLESTRAEPGCLEYVVAADPADPGRAVLLEKWESEEALAAHAEALKSNPPSPCASCSFPPTLSDPMTRTWASSSKAPRRQECRSTSAPTGN
jgi:hypothetical protein